MRKSVLSALVTLALGLIGTGLSTLYTQNESIWRIPTFEFKVSYGFPLGWCGYSETRDLWFWGPSPSKNYWFSPGSFLLDAAFWIAISFLVWIANEITGYTRKNKSFKETVKFPLCLKLC